MTLRDLMSRHARSILGDATSGFAEPITYRFKSGAADRTFNAVVKRLDLSAPPLAPQLSKRRANVEIPRHATLGVLKVSKGDSILLPMRIGDDPVLCAIRNIQSQDDALFVVQVEQQ